VKKHIVLLVIAFLLATSSAGAETVQLTVDGNLSTLQVSLATIPVTSGEYYEFEVKKDEGFFVSGSKGNGVLLPWSGLGAFIQIEAPDAVFRLENRITGLEITKTGDLSLSVGVTESGLQIWTGSGIKAKDLANFNRGSITVKVKKVSAFSAGKEFAMARKIGARRTPRPTPPSPTPPPGSTPTPGPTPGPAPPTPAPAPTPFVPPDWLKVPDVEMPDVEKIGDDAKKAVDQNQIDGQKIPGRKEAEDAANALLKLQGDAVKAAPQEAKKWGTKGWNTLFNDPPPEAPQRNNGH